MILVNVKFAETNQYYDFKVDESAMIHQVIDEMVLMIAEEEHLQVTKDRGLFMLCDPVRGEILSPVTTMTANGITSGRTLLLV